MHIKNFNGNDLDDYQFEIDRGGKFVIYQYCISVIFFSVKQSTGIYLVRGKESSPLKGLKYSLLSFVLGWWGIPWGPIYTIQCLFNNFKGGEDVTSQVMHEIDVIQNPIKQYF